ncbi:MAG TPA: formimidoylglutamase [Flavipsychrobacter sp.]|nr:formimidoylglutamase [Flavipsychrobacter sp.]
MKHFSFIKSTEISELISYRAGETKLGENIKTIQGTDWKNELATSTAKFVLLGIPEDIGVRANLGIGGTQSLWQPALKAVLNIQDTPFLSGKNLLVLGHFDFTTWMTESKNATLEELRRMVAAIDEEVYPLIETIVATGKIPIVIGGGHNNAYPNIKGASRAMNKKINCVNLDAHSDFRIKEGRHSGNGFRYAKDEGYLDKYALIGLHENYNSAPIIQELEQHQDIYYNTYDSIFIREQLSYSHALNEAYKFIHHNTIGIELDLDCIADTLSSAATPCGITTLQARQYIHFFGQHESVAYLHLTEGAVMLDDGRENKLTPKLAAYLVTDFMKAQLNQ